MDNRTKNEEGFPYNLWMEIFGDMPEEPLVQDQVDGIFAALDTLTPREKDAILYYNDGLDCDKRNCCKCGWNPAVCERRKKEIQEKLVFEARLNSAMKQGVNVK